MTKYSTQDQISSFIIQLGDRPFFICDLDGNVMFGFSLVPGKSLTLGPTDNVKNQDIPFGLSPEMLDKLVAEGVLRREIFAVKAMDARLPPTLVEIVNKNIKEGNRFSLGFLTSRLAEDALKLLEESGVKEPDQVTMVADSGATLYLGGSKTSVRTLSLEERIFLGNIDTMEHELIQIIKTVINKLGFNSDQCPDLYIETKGIAKNIHYRGILNKYGQDEGSLLDKEIGEAIKTQLQAKVERGPRNADGELIFTMLDGPATVEVKIAKVNKGHGLEALARAALTSGARPTALIFSGDDLSKGNGTPGTDYAAMIRGPSLSQETGIPIFNIHTHHPVGGDINSVSPDPLKSPGRLDAVKYRHPKIHLTVPTPTVLGSIILAALVPLMTTNRFISQLFSKFSLWSKIVDQQRTEEWLHENPDKTLALVISKKCS